MGFGDDRLDDVRRGWVTRSVLGFIVMVAVLAAGVWGLLWFLVLPAAVP